MRDAQLIADDRHQSLTTDKHRLTESIADIEASHPKEVESSVSSLKPSATEITPAIVSLAVEGSESGLRSDIFHLRLQTEVPGSIFVEKRLEFETRSLLEQIITVPLPPADTLSPSPTEPLEDLPALPSSEPSSRPGTPEIAAGSSGLSPLKFSENRLNTEAKAEYLRLSSGISQTPSGDQDLLPLSPDLSADSEYANGASFRPEYNTPSISPEFQDPGYLDSADASHPIDDPKDEDPSLSSFGSGIVQTVPVAQVGLRSPMFPGASGFGLFLGAVDSTTRRFFPQQGSSGIDDDPDYDSATREKDNQGRPTPATGIDGVEGSDESNQEGEAEEGWNSLS